MQKEISHTIREELLSSIPEERRDGVYNTTFEAMVNHLAKPGAAILSTMDDAKLNTLVSAVGLIVGACDSLDALKKVCVYNDEDPEVVIKDGGPFKVSETTPEQVHLLHMVVGVVGEAGELADAVLNSLAGETLDRENMREELGDLLFYMQGLMNALDMGVDEIQLANKVKLLGKRYAKGGYTDAQATARADKVEGQ